MRSQDRKFVQFIIVVLIVTGSNFGLCGEIHNIAKSGDLESAKALLKEKPGLVSSKDDEYGATPLHYAAAMGNKEMLELLLSKGADVNAKANNGKTPIKIATAMKLEDITELLRLHGADTTIHDAIKAGNLEISKTMIKDTPNLVTNYNELLCLAASTSNKPITELLLLHGANVNATNTDGDTALHKAAANGSKSLVELLLEKRANANAKDSDGYGPLHMAANSDVAQLLLENGAEINAKNGRGWTPLHVAVINGHKETEELLRIRGALDPMSNSIVSMRITNADALIISERSSSISIGTVNFSINPGGALKYTGGGPVQIKIFRSFGNEESKKATALKVGVAYLITEAGEYQFLREVDLKLDDDKLAKLFGVDPKRGKYAH